MWQLEALENILNDAWSNFAYGNYHSLVTFFSKIDWNIIVMKIMDLGPFGIIMFSVNSINLEAFWTILNLICFIFNNLRSEITICNVQLKKIFELVPMRPRT